MSSDELIYLIAAESDERESLRAYFQKHQFNCQVFEDLASAAAAIRQKSPRLIVLAGSNVPSPDICSFGSEIEQFSDSPIIALLTELQMSIVTEMADSENLWTAQYPISLREIRASILEALDELNSL